MAITYPKCLKYLEDNGVDVSTFIVDVLAAPFELRDNGDGVVFIGDWSAVPAEPDEADLDDDATVAIWHANAIAVVKRTMARAEGIDGETKLSVQIRAELGERNRRDSYLAIRIIELQEAFDAMKASTGGVANLRAAIPASWSATAIKNRPDARQDLRDEIDSGDSDN